MTKEPVNLFGYIRSLLRSGVDPADHQDEIWRDYGQTVAVMVVDSVGFSRVAKAHGILHFLTRLVMIRDVLGPVLEQHGATSTRFEADNIFATFDSVDSCVAAALALHVELREQKVMLTDDEAFRVCVGIGCGELLYSETLEGYFGQEMNLASKLGEDLAEGGETLLTAEAASHVSPALLSGFSRETAAISGLDLEYHRHRSE